MPANRLKMVVEKHCLYCFSAIFHTSQETFRQPQSLNVALVERPKTEMTGWTKNSTPTHMGGTWCLMGATSLLSSKG